MPFTLFGFSHLTVIIVTVFFSYLTFFQKRISTNNRKIIKNALVTLLILQIIVFNSWHLVHNSFEIQRFLPLHLCSLSAYISVFALAFNNQWLSKLQFFWGLVPASIALFLPEMSANENFPHFRFIEFFWSHSLIIITTFWIIFSGKLRLKYRDIWIIFVLLNAFAFGFVYWANQIFGSNYMYLMRKADGGQMNFLPAEPYHIFGLLGIFLLVFHLQFWIWNYFDKRNQIVTKNDLVK